MASFRAWIDAGRPRTLPLAATCVLIGAAIAKTHIIENPNTLAEARFWYVFCGALLTVITLQVLANFANDYGDFKKGTDGPERTDRAIASGSISLSEMKRALIVTSIKSLVFGCVTLWLAFSELELNLHALGLGALGVISILAALHYTIGDKAYGYKGLGDVFVLLFFGYVGVLGVGFLLTSTFEFIWLLPATFSGMMSVAVLNLNNLRDYENDAKTGKRTTVVRLGFKGGKRYHFLVLFVGWAALILFMSGWCGNEPWRGVVWYIIIALIHLNHVALVFKIKEPKLLDPELKKIALSSFVVALFMILSVTT